MSTDDRAEAFIKSKCDTDLTIQIERYELVDLVREYSDIENKELKAEVERLKLIAKQ